MRKLMYELVDNSGNSIIVRTLAEAKNTLGYTLKSVVLREDNPRLVFDGYNERNIKQHHYETLTEMLERD